jgi:hypothetical protein
MVGYVAQGKLFNLSFSFLIYIIIIIYFTIQRIVLDTKYFINERYYATQN